MGMPLEEAANILHTSKENLVQEGLKAYLREKQRQMRAEITSIHLKYGVSSLEDLDGLINAGKLEETDTFDDFAKLDHLESEVDKIKSLIEKLP